MENENKIEVEVINQELEDLKDEKDLDVSPSTKEIGWGLVLGIGYLTIFPVIILLIAMMFIKVPDPYVWGQDGPYQLVATVSQLIAGVLITIGMYKISTPLFKKTIKSFNGEVFKKALIYALISYATVIAVGMLDTALFGPSLTNANQQAVNNILFAYPIVGCALTMLIAPVTEELIFRFYIFRGLQKRSTALAYIVTALSFAGIHLLASVGTPFFLQDLRSIPIYTAAGLVFCYAYHKTNNMAVNIGAHMFYNTFATLLIFLVPQVNPIEVQDVKQTGTTLQVTLDENEEMGVNIESMSIYVYATFNPNELDEGKLQTINSETGMFIGLTPNTQYIIVIDYTISNALYGEVGEVTTTYIDLYTLS